MLERTLVLIKPDGIVRGLIGKIISRFEDAGFKIIAMKMVWIDENFAREHYKLGEEWARNVFMKTKIAYEKEGKKFPYTDHMQFGQTIQKWNVDFLREGPVVAIILEAPHAIEIARKIVGATEPRQAVPGTIRGDFATIESYAVANKKERVLRNLIHASDSIENASKEIALWFNLDEIHSYKKEMDDHF